VPSISFTSHLHRHLPCEPLDVEGENMAAVLTKVFSEFPELRSYLLDDQGSVRQHVMIFVDDKPLADRRQLSDLVKRDSRIYVMQALSGG